MPNICGVFNFKENKFSTKSDSIQSPDGKLVIISDAVLTNRTELLTKFGVLPSDESKTSDSHLILKSFEKFGEKCVEHLNGDFAFAIWNEIEKTLFCSRDHFGASTLFYYDDDKQFIISSEPKGLLSFQNIERKFNTNKLGTLLLPEPHTYLSDRSWFENIMPFPAGTSFTMHSNGSKKNKYWKPTPKKEFENRKEEDILDEFRALFFETISARLENGPNSICLLSGGLDSSSIVSVTAKLLEKQNRSLDVIASVLENENDEQFTDERFYIDQIKEFSNVNIKYVSAAQKGPFSELEDLFENFDSPIVTSRHYLYRAFNDNAQELGADTIFDGSFGETGATFHGEGGFAEMFSSFKWLTLWRELNLRKKLYRDPIKYNFRANTINPLLPSFLMELKKGKAETFHKYHFLQKDFAQQLIKNVDFEEFLPKPVSPKTQANQINEMSFIQKKLADMPTLKLGKNPIELRYPFLDKRLIEFTQSVPVNLKIKDGYNRYLIRAALDGILPPKIQWRTTKTPFSPDYIRRFNSQIESVRMLLNGIRSNDPICEILDIEKIKRWANLPVNESERYTTNEMLAREQIPQAIYLIYFMRKFPEFRL